MIGYVSVKASAKGKRREAEKLSHGMIHKIGAIVADVRKEGETLIDCIKRMKEELETLKTPAEETPAE